MNSSILKGKKLLILGGPALACDIVNTAKGLGVYTIVTDWYDEQRSPAKKDADQAFNVSTADVDAIVSLIKKEKIDGVITGFTDSTLPYYNLICEKAGLPCYLTQEQISVTANKICFKNLCKEFDIPVVEEYKLDSNFHTEQLAKIKYPVIVKPVDNSGARGISICQNETELIASFNNAMLFSESKTVIVERFMTSKEATLFYVINNGDIFLTAMGNRHTKHNQGGILQLPVAYTFPSKYLNDYQETLGKKVIAMFKSIGVENGIIFIQSFIENNKCIFYEMGYRLTGSLEYKITEKVNGINPLKMMIHFALTGYMDNGQNFNDINPNFSKYACNITFLAKPGVIGKIEGVDMALKIPQVVDVFPSYSVGDTIPESAIGTLSQVVLRAFAVADTKEELAKIMDELHNFIEVYSIEGDNMLLDTFNVKELYDDI
jgi:biotin carboxylase